jgi:hypothetical protein
MKRGELHDDFHGVVDFVCLCRFPPRNGLQTKQNVVRHLQRAKKIQSRSDHD